MENKSDNTSTPVSKPRGGARQGAGRHKSEDKRIFIGIPIRRSSFLKLFKGNIKAFRDEMVNYLKSKYETYKP
jgi:hypothetical protein